MGSMESSPKRETEPETCTLFKEEKGLLEIIILNYMILLFLSVKNNQILSISFNST